MVKKLQLRHISEFKAKQQNTLHSQVVGCMALSKSSFLFVIATVYS